MPWLLFGLIHYQHINPRSWKRLLDIHVRHDKESPQLGWSAQYSKIFHYPVLLNSEGVFPVFFLNALLNADFELNPTS